MFFHHVDHPSKEEDGAIHHHHLSTNAKQDSLHEDPVLMNAFTNKVTSIPYPNP